MWTRRIWTTAAQYGITVPVYDRETAELISAAAERTGKPVTVHYKLDTGMTRLGFPSWECEQTVQDILACSKQPGLISEGIFTHFAVADVPSGEVYTELQYKRFSDVCEGLQAGGLDLPLRHCANSGAYPDLREDALHDDPRGHYPVRLSPGCLRAAGARSETRHDRQGACGCRCAIFRRNTTISYGRTFETAEPTHMAVISMGYADRLSAYRLGQGAGAARRRESARARPHLHGYVHGAYSGGCGRTSR